MVELKNYMLFGDFGTAVSKLSERKDIKPRAKLALMSIYRNLEQRVSDIEKTRPSVKEGEKPSEEQIKEFDAMLNCDFKFDSTKICINDVIDILSSKDLLLLSPVMEE